MPQARFRGEAKPRRGWPLRFTGSSSRGNFKWYELVPNDGALGEVQTHAPRELFNQGCSLLSLYVYLADHKADTLARVVDTSEAFIARQNLPGVKFMQAAGSPGSRRRPISW